MTTISREVYETGQEPDYTIDDIAKVEYLRDGSIRLYLASEWRGGLRVEYTARVLTLDRLAEFGRALLIIAAEAHNHSQILDVVSGMH